VLHNWPASAWRNWNGNFDAIQTIRSRTKRRLESWKAGETGFPLVDAGMRQLRETASCTTGRMIVASFLVKDFICLAMGRRMVLDQLIDGDMAATSTDGSGALDAAPMPRRTSVFTDHAKPKSSTPRVTTSGAGSRS